MWAVVFHGKGDIRLEEVAEPVIEQTTDAIVRITTSAICGTDLHFIRGSVSGMKPGRILGHEGVGVIEALGEDVRNFSVGDRVVIPSTIACGYCAYCRTGYYAQCDHANPNGKQAGTAFYGGPEASGGFDGLQAEKARIPFAAINLLRLPDSISDDQGILLSDVFPTGYFGAELANVKAGHTVAMFGCGPVGQFAIASAKLMGAGRVFAVDQVADRLDIARRQGAEIIDFAKEDPVQKLRELTGGIGPDCAIEAVGVDAECPHGREETPRYERDPQSHTRQEEDSWQPGNAPSQSLRWATESLAKAGTLAIIGIYPPSDMIFPIGLAMNRNLTVRMGNCHHRKYLPALIDLVKSGTIEPETFLTRHEPMESVLEAYEYFAAQRPGWLKTTLAPR